MVRILFQDDDADPDAASAKNMRRLTLFDRSDSDRTKILKEVLRSAARSAADNADSGITEILSKSSPNALNPSRPSAKRRDVGPAQVSDLLDSPKVSQESLFEDHEASILQASVDADNSLMELVESDDDGVEQLGSALKCCSQRINGMCNRLLSPELQVLGTSTSSAPARLGADVRIVPRPEGEDAQSEAKRKMRDALRSGGPGALRWALDGVALAAEEAPVVERSRADKAAAAFIDEHTKFQQLEELSEKIEGSRSYADLRGAFAQRVKQHPALEFITDSLLSAPGELRSAISGGTPLQFSRVSIGDRLFVRTSGPLLENVKPFRGRLRKSVAPINTDFGSGRAARSTGLSRSSSTPGSQPPTQRSSSSQGGRRPRQGHQLHGTPSQRMALAAQQEAGGERQPTLMRPASSSAVGLKAALEPLARLPATPQAKLQGRLTGTRAMFSP